MTRYVFVLAAILSVAYAGPLQDRIVGGEFARNGQFPYEVSLRYNGRHRCGACIINEEWVLTAAHCVENMDIRYLSIVAGTTHLNQGGQSYVVRNYIYHANYSANADTTVDDIAIVRLRSSITFNDLIQPIALNTEEISSGDDMVLSGWGVQLYPWGGVSEELKFLRQKALSNTECQQKYQELGYEILDTHLCAFANDEEGACSGDSGSPLVFNGRVAGIATWVEPCGIGYPDAYTRVSSYIDWVEEQIAQNSY